MAHHKHGNQSDQRPSGKERHVEGERHSEEAMETSTEEELRAAQKKPSYTPQARTGQSADVGPEGEEKLSERPGFTPQERSDPENVKK